MILIGHPLWFDRNEVTYGSRAGRARTPARRRQPRRRNGEAGTLSRPRWRWALPKSFQSYSDGRRLGPRPDVDVTGAAAGAEVAGTGDAGARRRRAYARTTR